MAKKFFLLFFALLVFDQLVKLIVVLAHQADYNSGVFFGLSSAKGWLFYLILVAILYIVYLTIKNKSFGLTIALSGAVSNLIDRVFRDGVVDFISLSFWPTFNLSDLYILAGLLYFGFELFGAEKKKV